MALTQNEYNKRYRKKAGIKRIMVEIDPETFEAFKAACEKNGDSRGGIVKKAIHDYINRTK